MPSLYAYYQPSRTNHGSYWYYWTTWDEVAFKNFYRVWMQFVNEYKNMGGKVTTGSDAGFIFSTPGFATIEEMELLQEAGFPSARGDSQRDDVRRSDARSAHGQGAGDRRR